MYNIVLYFKKGEIVQVYTHFIILRRISNANIDSRCRYDVNLYNIILIEPTKFTG